MNTTQAFLFLSEQRDIRLAQKSAGQWVDELSQPEHWQAAINFLLSHVDSSTPHLQVTSEDLATFPRTLGTHITHCCDKHGCKYSDPMCLVEGGMFAAWHKCEFCDWEQEQAREVMEPVTSRFDDIVQEEWEKFLSIAADEQRIISMEEAFKSGARALIEKVVPF